MSFTGTKIQFYGDFKAHNKIFYKVFFKPHNNLSYKLLLVVFDYPFFYYIRCIKKNSLPNIWQISNSFCYFANF